jgi:hypothetical protein
MSIFGVGSAGFDVNWVSNVTEVKELESDGVAMWVPCTIEVSGMRVASRTIVDDEGKEGRM